MVLNKTLYISDLDGTLLNKSVKLSDYTIDCINKLIEKGLYFSVATARIPSRVRKILSNLKVNVPIILMNGALIYDVEKEIYVKTSKILTEETSVIVKIIRKFELTGFMYEFCDGILTTYHESYDLKPHAYIQDRIRSYSELEGFPDKSLSNIIYFTIIDTYERLRPVYDVLSTHVGLNQELYVNVYSPNLWFLEIFNSEVSKENAVKYLREQYYFEQIIGFGDNLNDLSMFRACDKCISVGNANSEVKSVADYICDTNDNDGVAKWLEENFK